VFPRLGIHGVHAPAAELARAPTSPGEVIDRSHTNVPRDHVAETLSLIWNFNNQAAHIKSVWSAPPQKTTSDPLINPRRNLPRLVL
jgi:hypothetical protein